MAATLVGYCRCSTDAQDVTAQRQRLRELGVTEDRIYLDHGLTGTNRARPGLDQALAALREGDTLVVPKLDRLARSVPDARDIGDGLAARGIKFPWRPGLRPDRPDGKDVLQHPGHLCGIRSRPAAPAHPRRNGRRPCVGAAQGPATEAVDQAADRGRRMHGTGDYTITVLAELFNISRPTVYRTIAAVETVAAQRSRR